MRYKDELIPIRPNWFAIKIGLGVAFRLLHTPCGVYLVLLGFLKSVSMAKQALLKTMRSLPSFTGFSKSVPMAKEAPLKTTRSLPSFTGFSQIRTNCQTGFAEEIEEFT